MCLIWFQTNSSSATSSLASLPAGEILWSVKPPSDGARKDSRCRRISMHRVDQRLDVPPLGLGPTKALLRVPRVPFVPLALEVLPTYYAARRRPLHDAVHVPFHRLLVEAIEPESVGRWRPRGAGLGYLLDGAQGVDEYSVYPRCPSEKGSGQQAKRNSPTESAI